MYQQWIISNRKRKILLISIASIPTAKINWVIIDSSHAFTGRLREKWSFIVF